jgi:hypothetical protein
MDCLSFFFGKIQYINHFVIKNTSLQLLSTLKGHLIWFIYQPSFSVSQNYPYPTHSATISHLSFLTASLPSPPSLVPQICVKFSEDFLKVVVLALYYISIFQSTSTSLPRVLVLHLQNKRTNKPTKLSFSLPTNNLTELSLF